MNFLGAGCEKSESINISDNIVGTWEWLYTLGGIIGRTYPNEGEIVLWEFTKDSVFIRKVNGIINLETEFHTVADTLWYHDSRDYRYLSKFQGDTIILIDLTSKPSFMHFFKRIN